VTNHLQTTPEQIGEKNDSDHLHGKAIIDFSRSLNAKRVIFHSITHLSEKTHEEMQKLLPIGFEPGYDGLPDWTNVKDESGSINMDGLQCGHVQENPFVGSYSLKFEANDNGVANTSSHCVILD